MTLIIRLVSLSCFVSVLGFSATWSGALVDANCYSTLKKNVNAHDHPASTDSRGAVRYCSPKQNTKLFAVVQHDSTILELDSAGNDKVMDLLAKTGKKSTYVVSVEGERTQNTIKLDTIALVK